jgi:hypothetical protein
MARRAGDAERRTDAGHVAIGQPALSQASRHCRDYLKGNVVDDEDVRIFASDPIYQFESQEPHRRLRYPDKPIADV